MLLMITRGCLKIDSKKKIAPEKEHRAQCHLPGGHGQHHGVGKEGVEAHARARAIG